MLREQAWRWYAGTAVVETGQRYIDLDRRFLAGIHLWDNLEKKLRFDYPQYTDCVLGLGHRCSQDAPVRCMRCNAVQWGPFGGGWKPLPHMWQTSTRTPKASSACPRYWGRPFQREIGGICGYGTRHLTGLSVSGNRKRSTGPG